MAASPYGYQLLNGDAINGYVVFRAYDVTTGLGVNVAYGGLKGGNGCESPPVLPTGRVRARKRYGVGGLQSGFVSPTIATDVLTRRA